jgi:hypothetical protein
MSQVPSMEARATITSSGGLSAKLKGAESPKTPCPNSICIYHKYGLEKCGNAPNGCGAYITPRDAFQ